MQDLTWTSLFTIPGKYLDEYKAFVHILGHGPSPFQFVSFRLTAQPNLQFYELQPNPLFGFVN